ncbi:MAG: MerR family transcriptional regulator [Arachnia sp.]
MLTIKQLADYVGVTPRAVRHYHRIGLLAEPERTASGYRSYTAQDVVDLRRIKVLSDAGVPLARVRALADAAPEELAEAVREIDAALATRIKELRATRKRLATLASGEDPYMSPKIAAVMAEYRAMGVSETTLRTNRDGWILVQAVYPRLIDPWLDWQLVALTDPVYRELCQLTDQVRDLAADDPLVEEVAQRSAAWILSVEPPSFEEWDYDAVAYRLLTTYNGHDSPGWIRLNERVGQLVAAGS